MMADVTDRWARVQTLFEQALDRPADERSAWLRAVCGDDPDLYREVEDLLAGDANHHTLFDGRVADLLAPADLDAALAPRPGEHVGPWVLGERIGAGGMGAVFRAERADDFEQTAAIKRVKPGMDSEAVLARFRAERQILARLDHPGIARLLGGGLDAEGRPYFAMELVEGEPITDHCDRLGLGVDDRLALFERVCEAVAYAHRQLVVHRDLKPSNVLVGQGARGKGDGASERSPHASSPIPHAPHVKLLDFGIAKVLSEDAAEAGLTQTGHRLLTPAAAAPEQVRGEPPTTATDVYALGGLLYRLLCGAPPLDPGLSLLEVERAVLEAAPERPSARVTPEAARLRGTTAAALAKRLRGDLDTICLMALRKEPERRYGSAAELLADVRRHRADLPVEARPATAGYRVGRFVRRHRAGVAGTAAAGLALVALAGFYTARLAAERDRAATEAATSAQTVEFLQGLFEGADPDAARGLELTAAELLAEGGRRIRTDLAGQPAVQAAMHLTIGKVYQDLGAYDSSRVHLERSVAMRDRLGDPLAAAASQTALAFLLRRTGEAERSVALHRAALAARRSALPPDHPLIAESLASIGASLHDLSRFDEAEAAYREAVAILQGTDHREVLAQSLDNLAGLLYDRGQYEEALAIGTQGLAIKEAVYGPVHTAVAVALGGQAVALHDLGRLEEAGAAYRRAIEIDRELLGEDHPDYAIDLNNYGTLLYDLRAYDEAEAVFDEALAVKRAALAPDHPQVATTLKSLGFLYSDMGRTEDAVRSFREAIAIRRAAYGDEHMGVAEATGGLARLYTTVGDHARAEPLYRETIATLSAVLGPESLYALLYRVRHADALHRLGRDREAAALFEQAVPAALAAAPDGSENRGTVAWLYGQFLADRGRCEDARPHLRAARQTFAALDLADDVAEVDRRLAACR